MQALTRRELLKTTLQFLAVQRMPKRTPWKYDADEYPTTEDIKNLRFPKMKPLTQKVLK